MSMSVQIDEATGATPTWNAAVTSCKFSLDDAVTGTTAVPVPTSTGTNFSYIKTFQVDITATNSLSMTNLMVGKVANETTTGTRVWHYTGHSAYTQATAAPTATTDNNVTAPTMNSATGVAMPLISAASSYGAGPFSSTGRVGNMVEVCIGVDATCTTAGSSVATPTIRFSWVEG